MYDCWWSDFVLFLLTPAFMNRLASYPVTAASPFYAECLNEESCSPSETRERCDIRCSIACQSGSYTHFDG